MQGWSKANTKSTGCPRQVTGINCSKFNNTAHETSLREKLLGEEFSHDTQSPKGMNKCTASTGAFLVLPLAPPSHFSLSLSSCFFVLQELHIASGFCILTLVHFFHPLTSPPWEHRELQGTGSGINSLQ